MPGLNPHCTELSRGPRDAAFRFRRIAPLRLALEGDDFRTARSVTEPVFIPAERRRFDQPAGRAPFARGEALALASAIRFRAAGHERISACDLDAALGQLSTRHLEALLSLETHSRPMIEPPPPLRSDG